MRRALMIVVVLVLGIVPSLGATASADSHLTGVLIALDAGHGGTETGAVGTTTDGLHTVREKDLNRAVVEELRALLEEAGATVVLSRDGDETVESRRDRVSEARDECKESELARDCDLLVSIHHNGASDHSVDYTQVFVTQKKDVALGQALYDQLVGLTNDGRGVSHDGFGMTVYGGLVSALTEAYFTTNHSKADYVWPALCTYVWYSGEDGKGQRCDPDVAPPEWDSSDSTIIEFEADLLTAGIIDYLATLGTGDGGGNGGGNDCPPGKAKRDVC